MTTFYHTFTYRPKFYQLASKLYCMHPLLMATSACELGEHARILLRGIIYNVSVPYLLSVPYCSTKLNSNKIHINHIMNWHQDSSLRTGLQLSAISGLSHSLNRPRVFFNKTSSSSSSANLYCTYYKMNRCITIVHKNITSVSAGLQDANPTIWP